MTTDPRLMNASLLALAAMRLKHRQASQAPDWERSEGLSSLLEAARSLPKREPRDLPALDPRDGLSRLLLEARQWRKERDGGPA